MIATLDQKMVGRYISCITSHKCMPVYMAQMSEVLGNEQQEKRALNGELTHIMYVKDGKIIVAWIHSSTFKWFFDAYGQ